MQHEELIISAASKASVTGDEAARAAGLARHEEIRLQYPWPEEA